MPQRATAPTVSCRPHRRSSSAPAAPRWPFRARSTPSPPIRAPLALQRALRALQRSSACSRAWLPTRAYGTGCTAHRVAAAFPTPPRTPRPRAASAPPCLPPSLCGTTSTVTYSAPGSSVPPAPRPSVACWKALPVPARARAAPVASPHSAPSRSTFPPPPRLCGAPFGASALPAAHHLAVAARAGRPLAGRELRSLYVARRLLLLPSLSVGLCLG